MGKRSYGVASSDAQETRGPAGPLAGRLDERRARALPVIMALAGLVSVGMLAAPVPGVGVGTRLLLATICAPVMLIVPVGLVVVPLHRYGHSRRVLQDHLQPRVRWVMGAIGLGALLVSVVPLLVPFGVAGVVVLVLGAVGLSLLTTGTVLFLLAKGML